MNVFDKLLINSNFNFDKEREEASMHLGCVWKIESLYSFKML